MMRRTQSNESLGRLEEQHPALQRFRHHSTPVVSCIGRRVKSDQDLKQLFGTPPRRSRAARRVSMAGYVEAYHLPPPQDTMTNEMAEDVMEASFARGLAAAECFELYGPVKKAPDLAGTSLDPSHAASSQQLATSQQLASCLATPFTGTEKNMGEIVQSEVDKMDANRELQTQLRYAEELRHRKETAEEEEDEELAENLDESSVRRARIRRKPSDEVLDEQLMQEVAITGARPTLKGRGELPSPEARATLDSIYGSMDDPTNKLILPEPIQDGEDSRAWPQAPLAHLKAKGGAHVRPFIVNAMSYAPDLC